MRSGRLQGRLEIGVPLKVNSPPQVMKGRPLGSNPLPLGTRLHLRPLELARTFHNPKFIL